MPPGKLPQVLTIAVAAASACGTSPSQHSVAQTPTTSVAATYDITLRSTARLQGRPSAHGTLVLVDTTISTRAKYLPGRPFNACLTLYGDLQILALAPSDSSFTLSTWRQDSVGILTLSVYQGVDYGYRVDVLLNTTDLRGKGAYYGAGAMQGTNRTAWRGTRRGPADMRECARALRQDSVWAARRHR